MPSGTPVSDHSYLSTDGAPWVRGPFVRSSIPNLLGCLGAKVIAQTSILLRSAPGTHTDHGIERWSWF
jgi:hypothetical protein